MTKAEKVITEALLSMTKDTNEPKIIMLQDVDKDYWEFFIQKRKMIKEKTNYIELSLYAVTRSTYPDSSLLITVTNIAYSWNGMIQILAEVMDKMWNHKLI